MARALVKEIKDTKKNYVINGNFDYWQRTTANQTFGAQIAYHADRFAWAAGTITGAVTSSKSVVTNYSNNTIIPRTCRYMQQYTVSTAQPSLTGDSTAGPWYKIEGYDWGNLLEQGGLTNGFTLSFYVASSVVGTYTIELFNNSVNNRMFKTYQISNANTWQRVSIYLSPVEIATGIASGTWNESNTIGLGIRFWLAVGVNSQGANQNVWTGSAPNVPAAQVNFLSTLANSWGITGLQVTIGNVIPSFRIRGETYAEELRLCQRYYEKSYNTDVNPATVTAVGIIYGFNADNGGTSNPTINYQYKVSKRANCTTYYYNSVTGATGTWRTSGGADLTISQLVNSENGISLQFTTPLAAGNAIAGHFASECEL